MTVDLVNTFLTFWLKPMCLLALMMSIAKSSFYFSAASSHWFLSCAFFVTILMTLLGGIFTHTLFSPISLPLLPQFFAPLLAMAPLQNSISLAITYSFVGLYTLGVCWILCFQFFGLLEIRSMSKRAKPVMSSKLLRIFEGVKAEFELQNQHIALKLSDDVASPVVWGWRRALVLLPESSHTWKGDRLKRVLAHELAHVSRHDWVIKVMGKFFNAFFWPLPLSWIVLRKIEWFCELACDDKVIKHYDCRAEYAEDLLCVSRQRETSGWAMSFNRKSQVFQRIQYILDGRNQREDLPARRKLANAMICFVVIAPVFLFQAAPSSANKSFFIWGSDLALIEQVTQRKFYHDVSVVDVPQWPYEKTQFVQILPDSPRFLEEMTVSANAEDFKEFVEPSSPNDLAGDLLQVAASKLPKPRLEVKGYLPRVMHTPQYPRNALRKGIEGKVIVQFDIDEKGSVIRPRVVYASPKNIFEKSVLKALKKSQFVPMEIQGRAIITKNISETFSFRLDSTSK